jgi:hypothetical protein
VRRTVRATVLTLGLGCLAPQPSWGQAPASAPPRSHGPVCEFMEIVSTDTVHGTERNCLVDYKPAPQVTVRISLDRYDTPGEACAYLDQKRGELPRDEPRGTVVELGDRYGDEGYEMASPQYAVERLEGDTRVVDIHPAKFDLHFCQPPYRFYAYSMYTPKDAPAVPPEVAANIRFRARTTADRLIGLIRDGAPADFGLLDAVAPSLDETLEEPVRLGLIQRKDVNDGMSALRYSPEIRSLSARFKPFFGDRAAAGFSGLTVAERQVVTTLIGAVALSGMDDSRGRPLFPAVSANVEILTHLGLTAMGEDPARAHQARTALTRYAGMLRDLDLRALEERHGNGQAEGPS